MTDIEPVSVLYISTSLSLLCREINLHLKQSVFVDHRDIESLQLRHDELKASIEQLRIHALTYKYGHGLSAASWKQVMDTSNHVVDAIKAARMAYGLGIKDARDLVIAYRDKKYAFSPRPQKYDDTQGSIDEWVPGRTL